MTMQQAADAAGMTLSGLSNAERGVNGTQMATLRKMADAYGCMVGDLLPHAVPAESSNLADPLLAVMAGLPDAEISQWMTHFAQIATLQLQQAKRIARTGQPPAASAERRPGRPDDRPGLGWCRPAIPP